MKCVCGYEGQYFMPTELYRKPPSRKKKWDPDFKEIFVCPKCGTLKVHLEEIGDNNEKD